MPAYVHYNYFRLSAIVSFITLGCTPLLSIVKMHQKAKRNFVYTISHLAYIFASYDIVPLVIPLPTYQQNTFYPGTYHFCCYLGFHLCMRVATLRSDWLDRCITLYIYQFRLIP